MLSNLQKRPILFFYAVAMVTLMLFMTVAAFRLGMADLMAVRAENTLNAFKNGTRQKPEVLHQAAERVQGALEINRHYAPYIEIRGNIELARRLDADNLPGQETGVQHAAIDQFRQLLYYRPTWAFGWGGLILAKIDQLEFDDELIRSLEQVATRYPFMPQVQVLTATSALSAWQFLEAGSREKLARTIRYAYSLQPETLKDAADSFGEMEVLCSLVEGACKP